MPVKTVKISALIDQSPLRGFQKLVVALCALLAFVEGFDAQNAGYVAPALARAWNLAPATMGLFFSLGLFGLMLGALFVAPLADRVGRKPVLLTSLVLFGACSLGMAASTTTPMLFTFRFFTGLGIGAAMPNVIALTSEYAPKRIRALMVSLMFSGFILGSIAAGLTAARIVEALGWNSVFIVGGVLPLLLAPLALALLPESVRFLASKNAADPRVAALMRKIDPSLPEGAKFQLDDHAEARMSVAALFQNGRARRTVCLWIVVFCGLLDLFFLSNWLPTRIAALGVSVGIAIFIGTLLQVGGLFGVVLGWLMSRLGASRTLATSYAFAAVGIGSIGLVGDNVFALALAVLAAGFGIVGGQTVGNAAAAETYPTEIRSTGVGWFLGIGRIGSIIGPSVAGLMFAAGMDNRDVFLLAVIPALCAVLAAVAMGHGSVAAAPVTPR